MATCPSCRNRYADDVTICALDGSQLHADEAPRKPADPLEGQLVGEYRIEKKIVEKEIHVNKEEPRTY